MCSFIFRPDKGLVCYNLLERVDILPRPSIQGLIRSSILESGLISPSLSTSLALALELGLSFLHSAQYLVAPTALNSLGHNGVLHIFNILLDTI